MSVGDERFEACAAHVERTVAGEASEWVLLCSIGYIAYTIIATAESRLRSGAGGRSLEQHEEGDAATLEGLGVGIV